MINSSWYHIKRLFKKFKNNPTLINIITVATVAIIIKGFGFYKEIIVASNFGLSELLDTFFIAALVPGFISSVFLSNFNSVFIPNYIAEQKTTNRISSFQTTSFIVTIGTALLFMFIAYLFTDVYLETFFSGHTEDYYKLVITQFNYLLPCIVFWGLTSMLSGLLNIYDEFIFSSIYPVITSLSIIICLVFFQEELNELVIAVGTLAGSVCQFLFLFSIAAYKKILRLGIPDFSNSNAITMFRQMPAKISSGVLSGVNPLVDQFFSAQLVIGSLTALNYGVKIPSFFICIVGI
jgi:putative peptidoglycan lipid II flippase